jgi:predicted glycoside hydrolase/deacetylase ChbG (UPF0249 family)
MPDTAKAPAGEPWTPGRIVVCADDYGAEPETSAVIRGLINAGRINATTCLVESATWPAEAAALDALTAPRPTVGLHLNLTERFHNVAEPGLIASIGTHVARAFMPSGAAYQDRLRAAFRAQWDRFVAAFGRAPDFIDGHEHVHLFPAPRRALFDVAAEVGFTGWMRQCETASRRASAKRLVLDPFSRAFRRDAEAHGFATNPGFGGLRRFDPAEDLARIWREDLAAMTGGGLLMVHPGAPDATTGGRCRHQEARLLDDGELDTIQREVLGNDWHLAHFT